MQEPIVTHGEEFVTQSLTWLTTAIQATIEQRGECIVGLSGGSTPKAVYSALGNNSSIDWTKVFWFLVDERFIEPTSDDSNRKLVEDTLLQAGNIPVDQFITPDTTQNLQTCIAQYTKQLTNLFSNHAPDIIVLGLGSDGHIASLFPPVPEIAFTETLVLHTQTDEFAVHDRISVSPLVLLSASRSLLLLRGKDKQAVYEQCTAAEMDPVRWPLHIVQATDKLEVIVGI